MGEKIEIYHFVPGFKFGGIESRTMELFSYVDKEKFCYNFVTFAKDNNCEAFLRIKENGGKIITVSPLSLKTLKKHISDVRKVFQNNKVDVAHCYSPQSGLFFLYYANKYGVKTRILHARTSSFEGGKMKHIKSIVKKAEVHYSNVRLAVSRKAGDWLFGNKEYLVIPNAVNVEKYYFSQSKREEIRSELGINDALVIGHVGRSTFAKNHSYLFSVFEKLLAKVPEAKLLLVGPERNDLALIKICDQLGITNSVIFAGYQTNVSPFYSVFDFLVFPSFYEGLPGTLIEAQVSGLKCFASDTITEEVRLTDCVEFFSIKDNPEIWADNIIKSIGYNRCNRNEEIEETGYSLKNAAEQIMKIYRGETLSNET